MRRQGQRHQYRSGTKQPLVRRRVLTLLGDDDSDENDGQGEDTGCGVKLCNSRLGVKLGNRRLGCMLSGKSDARPVQR